MAASAQALHTHAVQAEKHTEALATGLGQAGADDQVVKTISQCAEILRQVAAKLGDRGAQARDQQEAAPADQGQQAPADQQAAQAPPEQQPPTDQANPEAQPARHQGIHEATQALVSDVKKKRQAAQSPS